MEPSFKQDFIQKIPTKPYCTDQVGVTYIRPASTAINKNFKLAQKTSHIR